MPEHLGFSHVSLSVRNLATSERWYRDALGFEAFDRPPGHGWEEVVLLHRQTGTVLCLQEHEANQGESFDPTRTGADHLAFRVASRHDLVAWEEHLSALGLEHSAIADRDYGSVLCFRDPDDFQLELFWREHHP